MPSTGKIEVKNKYQLMSFKQTDGTPGVNSQEVVFYKMNEDGTWENGTTLEEMLKVSIERLQQLNGMFPCRENSVAITKMEEALMWLNKRTENRKARGVEGKHIV